jgi:centromere protein I
MDREMLTMTPAATVPAKQRAVKISSLVDRVCLRAYEDGLSNASLDKAIDIIRLSNEFDQASTGKLIRNLYPVGRVPDTVVIKVVSSLGHGRAKASYTTQVALLKWLVMVYDVLENQPVLSRLYSVLFNLLDTIAIRYAFERS